MHVRLISWRLTSRRTIHNKTMCHTIIVYHTWTHHKLTTVEYRHIGEIKHFENNFQHYPHRSTCWACISEYIFRYYKSYYLPKLTATHFKKAIKKPKYPKKHSKSIQVVEECQFVSMHNVLYCFRFDSSCHITKRHLTAWIIANIGQSTNRIHKMFIKSVYRPLYYKKINSSRPITLTAILLFYERDVVWTQTHITRIQKQKHIAKYSTYRKLAPEAILL